MNISKELHILINHLDNDEPFIFAKFGDGEGYCMDGRIGENCDRHPYSPELGKRLQKSLFKLSSRHNAYITNWPAEPIIKSVSRRLSL